MRRDDCPAGTRELCDRIDGWEAEWHPASQLITLRASLALLLRSLGLEPDALASLGPRAVARAGAVADGRAPAGSTARRAGGAAAPRDGSARSPAASSADSESRRRAARDR